MLIEGAVVRELLLARHECLSGQPIVASRDVLPVFSIDEINVIITQICL